ncbi:MAG: amidotransferase [Gemmatimonadetes bacterium]|nr:amidotransferase [Gemmatimonadota bacterium]MYF73365.1 amidotransferase [Gemmatimonadota bacterium]MYK51566.1 amidotransferase [Gemmatimonadota bacterium]
MKLHYLQHVPFEGLGSIASWAKARRAQISRTRLFAGEALPSADEIDLLIVLGGPMGVYDERDYPWLIREKDFLKQAIDTGTHILGVCLGAQLIADVLGARVYPNDHKEIGWFPIEGVQTHEKIGLLLAQAGKVFHWHGDTYDLPTGATHLAKSRACKHQAFSVGNQILALQFHLETTPNAARALVDNCGHEIVEAPYIQPPREILTDQREFERINRLMSECLDLLIPNKKSDH